MRMRSACNSRFIVLPLLRVVIVATLAAGQEVIEDEIGDVATDVPAQKPT